MDGLPVSRLDSGLTSVYNEARKGDGAVKKKKKSRIGYRVAAGVMDVFGAAGAALAILLLTLMFGSLISWLRQDLAITFSDLTDNLTDAVIITEKK